MTGVYAQRRGSDIEVVCPTEGRAHILCDSNKRGAVIFAAKRELGQSCRVLIRPESAKTPQEIKLWAYNCGMPSSGKMADADSVMGQWMEMWKKGKLSESQLDEWQSGMAPR
jgi:hypothetical protein